MLLFLLRRRTLGNQLTPESASSPKLFAVHQKEDDLDWDSLHRTLQQIPQTLSMTAQEQSDTMWALWLEYVRE